MKQAEITEYFLLVGLSSTGAQTILQTWPACPTQAQLDVQVETRKKDYVRLVLLRDMLLIEGSWKANSLDYYY